MEAKRTAGPWTLSVSEWPDNPMFAIYSICGPVHAPELVGEVVARYTDLPHRNNGHAIYPDRQVVEGNARRIVQCVNAHDELLEALQEALGIIALLNGKDNTCHPMVDVSTLRAVIAKATGGAA